MAREVTLYFRSTGAGYEVRAASEGLSTEWRRVQPSNAEKPSLDDLVDEATGSAQGLKLLRIVSEQHGTELPPWSFRNLSKVRGIGGRAHLMDFGTVAVEGTAARAYPCSGNVVVVDAPELAAGLRFGKVVTSAKLKDLHECSTMLRRAILVAGPSIEGEAVQQVEALAYEQTAAMVIWCAREARSNRPMLEVRTFEPLTLEQETAWLGEFVRSLRTHRRPPYAMLDAYRHAKKLGVPANARWLCEHRNGDWKLELSAPAVPRYWQRTVDRFAQGAMVEQLRSLLKVGKFSTRVQVVVAFGSRQAGLEHFVARFAGDKRFEWGEDEMSQFENLAQQLRPTNTEEDPVESFVAYARGELAGRLAAQSDEEIACISHEPECFSDSNGNGTTLQGLKTYLKGLSEVAERLANDPMDQARLIVHLPILLSNGDDGTKVKQILRDAGTAYLRLSALPALSDHVPTDELLFWLECYGLSPDEIRPEERGQPYQQLLERLRERYGLQN